MTTAAVLALEDGTIFHGISIGIEGQSAGEVVFNTSLTGYQEIITDPSYCRQIVTLTYPHIGNTGTNSEDLESERVHAAGLIIRDLPLLHSNWRADKPLDEFLRQAKVVALAGIDTRKLTRILRDKGAQAGCLQAGKIDPGAAVKAARAFPGLQGMDLAKVVSTREKYQWNEGTIWPEVVYFPSKAQRLHVVAYDFGIKRNILRILSDFGCRVTVVPARTPAGEVLKMAPDGIFLSNGPGDPEPCDYAISAIEECLASGTPIFGICLGHQLLCLACGAATMKMKFGHHGGNHPVQDLETKRVMITSQNHGFCVDETNLPEDLEATHRSLFDGTLQGIRHARWPAFGFQGHPEASPGPHDIRPLFEQFVKSMLRHRVDVRKKIEA